MKANGVLHKTATGLIYWPKMPVFFDRGSGFVSCWCVRKRQHSIAGRYCLDFCGNFSLEFFQASCRALINNARSYHTEKTGVGKRFAYSASLPLDRALLVSFALALALAVSFSASASLYCARSLS